MAELAFVLINETRLPAAKKVIAAAKSMGISLKHAVADIDDDKEATDTEVVSFEDDSGVTFMVALMPAPHPDVEQLPQGPFSPEDYDELVKAPAHLILTAFGFADDAANDEIDITMCAFAASVANASESVGVLKIPGAIFYSPALFAECAKEGVESNELPILICVDVTLAAEEDGRVSVLTHNMPRYDREDLLIKFSRENTEGVDFMLDMMNWMLSDRAFELPTGDTIGRTEDEKILVQRVENPVGKGADVVLFDLE